MVDHGVLDHRLPAAGRWAEALAAPWWWVLLLGVSTLAFGIFAVAWPGRTLLVLVVLFGAHLLVFGMMRFISAFALPEVSARWLIAITGVLGVIAGLLVLRRPFRSLAVIVTILGLYWLFSGFIEVFHALLARELPHRGWVIFEGVGSVIAGGLILMWPAITLLALALVLGWYLIVRGIVEIVGSFRLRKAERAGTAEAAVPSPS